MPGMILFCLSFLYLVASVHGSCGKMCCPGRNNTCHTVGDLVHASSSKPVFGRCFCDESCVDMGDCCLDYEKSCSPVDCQVSPWTEWSGCSKLCGVGMMKRSRKVMVHPRNGGLACPNLHGSNVCFGKTCETARHVAHSGDRVLKETARIMPGAFGKHRTSLQYDYRKDIRKNLFYQYHAKHQPTRTQTCREFRVVSSKRACRHSSWASVLRVGTRVCVECQETAMKRELGWRCRGQGEVSQQTYWSANGVSGCHGWWEMQDGKSNYCKCKGDKSIDFLFV